MPENVQPRDKITGKAILCMLKTNVHDHVIFQIKLDELKNLANAIGIKIVDEFVQTRYRPGEKSVIGKGKISELKKKVEKNQISLIIFYNLLKSSQKLNLIKNIGCDVIDRYELTLEIFDQMSSDNLSKLQIELAKLDKLTPFYKLAANVNFTHDRPFFHSGGEYAFRGQLRELTRRQSNIRQQIQDLVVEKRKQIVNRKKLGYPTVCIAGYYNAGKTSLFNALTGDNKPVSDRPFTTLSSKYQRRYIDPETSVMFIDTIGFVIDLDHRLIKSFQLNFEDIRSADIVILLFDISDPALVLKLKLQEGLSLLKDIEVNMRRVILVFNKVDIDPKVEEIISEELTLDRYELPWISVSAAARKNLQGLLQLIAEKAKELDMNPIEINNKIDYSSEIKPVSKEDSSDSEKDFE